MSKTSLRALRVGVLIGDTLVEERVFTTAAPITFGQSARCTLSVPVDGVPAEHLLFACDDGRYLLRLDAAMDGRLAGRDTVDTFDELRRTTAAIDGVWIVPLPRGARGRLRVGEATLLFQEIARPPTMPRPQLPASIRGTFADRIDRRLAMIVGGSLVVHVAIAAWAWTSDSESDRRHTASAERLYHYDTVDVMLPDPVVTQPTQPTQPGTATPVAPQPTTRPIVHRPRADEPPWRATRDDGARIASILTDDTTRDGGPGEMRGRQPGGSLDRQIEDARNKRITIGGDPRSRVDDRAHIDVDHRRDLPIDDPTIVRTQPRHDDGPKGRLTIGPVHTDEPTTLTPDAVVDKIRTAYYAGLERCYHKAQVVDPTLSGKIALTFTVESHGRVTDPEASGVTAQVDSCIQSQMASWHFPAPRTKTGEPTDASYKISLALQP
jgi:hypothetical protein